MADIKFSVVVEHRAVDVHLHDVSVLGLLFVWGVIMLGLLGLFSLLYDAIQFIDLVDYDYASALVTILPRFHDPDIPSFTLAFLF